MYADTVTPSMQAAIDETNRRRLLQMDYNRAHGITPQTIKKSVRDLIEIGKKEAEASPENKLTKLKRENRKLSADEKAKLIEDLTAEMKAAAKKLEFERAAALRDRIKALQAQN